MDIIDKAVSKIKDLKIQGATNIALMSLKALKKDWQEKKYQEIEILKEEVEKLKKSRPTEPLLFNILKSLLEEVKMAKSLDNLGKTVDLAKEKVLKAQEEVAKNGAGIIRDGMTVLTHCHSTTVVEIFKKAKREGRKFKIFLTETRPLYQGRITAKELVKEGIEVTMVVDAAASYIISKEDEIPINLVLLGCDAISPKKGVFNKIGTYGLTLSAYEAKIPVFVAGSLLKTFIGQVNIEKRRVKEIWKGKPRDLKILNLAFDLIPHKFITAMITEFGLVKPERIFKLVSQNYPFILR